ncbi:MAG TPA: efflux RND transporter periplasmic adaptor subunit [Chitinophagaceae bacterium]|nr:efflux RND transporter periplasmic adaptor subunit [Chitinophagaceae bacterium]
MKQITTILAATLILASCGGEQKNNKEAELAKLKKERSSLDAKIKTLEAETAKKNPAKATPVTVMEVKPTVFTSYIEVQSQVVGDENVLATPQAPGMVTAVNVHAGQKVSRGQVLATLDAAATEQQIKGVDIKINLTKSVYERTKNLWEQHIGSEVKLLQVKAEYEGALKEKEALMAQRNMYRIISPISGTVDNVSLKPGDMAGGQSPNGIRVVNFDKLKAEANLGENYLGKVQAGDKVTLVFPDLNDSINTKISYVARQVDPVSRAFLVQIRLGNNSKIYPNMSAKMQISNYENHNALVVPVQVIQKTAEGDMLYVADGNKAKSVIVKTGRNANGLVEVLSGLNSGDKVITEGYGDIDNGEAITTK